MAITPLNQESATTYQDDPSLNTLTGNSVSSSSSGYTPTLQGVNTPSPQESQQLAQQQIQHLAQLQAQEQSGSLSQPQSRSATPMEIVLSILGGPAAAQGIAQQYRQQQLAPIFAEMDMKFNSAIRSGDIDKAQSLLAQFNKVSQFSPYAFQKYSQYADAFNKITNKVQEVSALVDANYEQAQEGSGAKRFMDAVRKNPYAFTPDQVQKGIQTYAQTGQIIGGVRYTQEGQTALITSGPQVFPQAATVETLDKPVRTALSYHNIDPQRYVTINNLVRTGKANQDQIDLYNEWNTKIQGTVQQTIINEQLPVKERAAIGYPGQNAGALVYPGSARKGTQAPQASVTRTSPNQADDAIRASIEAKVARGEMDRATAMTTYKTLNIQPAPSSPEEDYRQRELATASEKAGGVKGAQELTEYQTQTLAQRKMTAVGVKNGQIVMNPKLKGPEADAQGLMQVQDAAEPALSFQSMMKVQAGIKEMNKTLDVMNAGKSGKEADTSLGQFSLQGLSGGLGKAGPIQIGSSSIELGALSDDQRRAFMKGQMLSEDLRRTFGGDVPKILQDALTRAFTNREIMKDTLKLLNQYMVTRAEHLSAMEPAPQQETPHEQSTRAVSEGRATPNPPQPLPQGTTSREPPRVKFDRSKLKRVSP